MRDIIDHSHHGLFESVADVYEVEVLLGGSVRELIRRICDDGSLRLVCLGAYLQRMG